MAAKIMYLWWQHYKVITLPDTVGAKFWELIDDLSVDIIFVGVDADFTGLIATNVAALQAWIQQAKNRGVEIHPTIGGLNDDIDDPSLTHQDEIEAIIQWNNDYPAYAFEGMHFDLELDNAGYDPDYTNAQFMAALLAYMQTVKTYTSGGETIVSLGLTLSMDMYSGWVNYDANWTSLLGEIDMLSAMDYCKDPLDQIAQIEDMVDSCVTNGVPFIVLVQSHERHAASDPYTFYSLGRDGYFTAANTIDTYYTTNYAADYYGLGHHHFAYMSRFYCVDASDIVWPSGSYAIGQQVQMNITVLRNDGSKTNVIGVKVEFRDDDGTVYEASSITWESGWDTTITTVNWAVPQNIKLGNVDVKVSIWDLGWPNSAGSSLLLYHDFEEGAEWNLLAGMSMTELADYEPPLHSTWTGRRDDFVELWYSDWELNAFNIGGGVETNVWLPRPLTRWADNARPLSLPRTSAPIR